MGRAIRKHPMWSQRIDLSAKRLACLNRESSPSPNLYDPSKQPVFSKVKQLESLHVIQSNFILFSSESSSGEFSSKQAASF